MINVQNRLISQYIRNNDGKWFLEVEGAPFLFHSMQGGLLPGGQAATGVKAAAELCFQTYSVCIPWDCFEPSRGSYLFEEIDELIRLAGIYNMRLDLLWSGADHEYSPDMFEAEYEALRALIHHLRDYDTARRVISLQLENVYDASRFATPSLSAIVYKNRLAGEIKELEYKIAVRVNITGREDLQERREQDIYVADIQYTKRMLRSGDATRFRYSENGNIIDSVATHIVEALAYGAFYSRYTLDEYRENTALQDLNRSLNHAHEIIATAAPHDMTTFGTGSDPVLYGQSFTPAFEAPACPGSSPAVGLLVHSGEFIYIFGSGDAFFDLPSSIAEATAGTFKNGIWAPESGRFPGQCMANGQYRLSLHAGECVRIAFQGERL